jgi:hypothetical protein
VQEKVKPTKSTAVTEIPNPAATQLPAFDTAISQLRAQRAEKESGLLNVRPQLQAEIESKVGFLDELKVMFHLITGSTVALIVWLLWFCFLVGLEMLMLVSKWKGGTTDYEETVQHQMDHQLRKLKLLSGTAEKEMLRN